MQYALDRETGMPVIQAAGNYDLATVSADDLLTAFADVVVFDLPAGFDSVILGISGAAVLTALAEFSMDGVTWFAQNGFGVVTGSSGQSFGTGVSQRYNASGWSFVRVRCSAYTSGAGQVRARAVVAPNSSQYVFADTELPAAVALSDAIAGSSVPTVGAMSLDFNGSTWERHRFNETRLLLASAARTATPAPADQLNYGSAGLVVTINVTAIGVAPSVVPAIQFKDAAGVYYTLLTGAAITAIGATILRLDPRLPAVANLIAQVHFGRTFRVNLAHSNADSITYSVSADLVG